MDGLVHGQTTVFVSGGRRGLQVELTPEALIAGSGALVAGELSD